MLSGWALDRTRVVLDRTRAHPERTRLHPGAPGGTFLYSYKSLCMLFACV